MQTYLGKSIVYNWYSFVNALKMIFHPDLHLCHCRFEKYIG